MGEFTALLQTARGGDPDAEGELFSLVYDELRGMAGRRMQRVPRSDTLQATGLVHETYLRLAKRGNLGWADRRHFFALAARVMRDVLVDQARRHGALKRGGGMRRTDLKDQAQEDAPDAADILSVGEAIETLSRAQPLAANVVILRIFEGLKTHAAVAQALEISEIRARREWAYAKAFLGDRLRDSQTDG